MTATTLATSAVTFLVAATGCGAGDESGSGALSKDEYYEQSNALCRKAIFEAEAKVREDPPRSSDEVPDAVELLFDTSFSYIAGFKALEPPEERREAHEEFVRVSEDSRAVIDGLVQRLRDAEDPQALLPVELRKLVLTREFSRGEALTRELALDCLDIADPSEWTRARVLLTPTQP